jgi:hypothetical protein
MNNSIRAILFLLLVALWGCKSDRPPKRPYQNNLPGSGAVWIGSEGNFMFGNADLCQYDPTEKQVWNDRFREVHNRALGDVLQSAVHFEQVTWLVMNNSSKLIGLKIEDMAMVGEIAGLQSPRYMAVHPTGRALVTDLYANGVHVVDLVTFQKTGFIPIVGWNESVVLLDQKFLVLNRTRGLIFLIDASTLEKRDSIPVMADPNSMALDAQGDLWVLGETSQGNYELWQILVSDFAVTRVVQLAGPELAFRLMTGRQNDLYWLHGDLMRLDLSGQQPPEAIIAGPGKNFYGFGIHPISQEIYLADAHDYIRRGTIYRHKPNGDLIDTFHAGIIPAFFWFQ